MLQAIPGGYVKGDRVRSLLDYRDSNGHLKEGDIGTVRVRHSRCSKQLSSTLSLSLTMPSGPVCCRCLSRDQRLFGFNSWSILWSRLLLWTLSEYSEHDNHLETVAQQCPIAQTYYDWAQACFLCQLDVSPGNSGPTNTLGAWRWLSWSASQQLLDANREQRRGDHESEHKLCSAMYGICLQMGGLPPSLKYGIWNATQAPGTLLRTD